MQVYLQDVKFTPEFVDKVKKLPDDWKNFLLKLSNPTGLVEKARDAGSDIKIAQAIHDKLKPIYEGLKRIFGM